MTNERPSCPRILVIQSTPSELVTFYISYIQLIHYERYVTCLLGMGFESYHDSSVVLNVGLVVLPAGGFLLLILACLALSASAQEFTNGPKIVSVTPKDSGATIAFIAPKESENTPEILEYQVECSVPGDSSEGVSVFVLEGIEKTAELYGLENGYSYTCTMFARGASGGLLPRAINSPVSNPSPLFSPKDAVQATIFVEEPKKDQAPAAEKKETETEVPPTNPEESSPVLPKAPSIKDTEVTEDGKVKIVFSLPAGDESSPITGFIAACQNNGDATKSSQAMVPAGSTSALVEGLSTPGEYTCSVAASTADGVGASSTKIVVVGEAKAVGDKPAEDVGAQDGPSQEKSSGVRPLLSAVGAIVISLLLLS